MKFFAQTPRILEQPQVAIQYYKNRKPSSSSLKLSQANKPSYSLASKGMLKSLISLFKVQG